jgi:KDO2-lipid IV(A) lauroyltransferase
VSSAPPAAAWRETPILRDSLYSLGAVRLARTLAHVLPHGIGLLIARAVAKVSAGRNSPGFRCIRENLRVITGLRGRKLDRLAARNVTQFSAMLADYFYSTSDDGRWAKRLLGEWSGWEHIQAARAAGRGVILVTGHLGHWELGGLLLAQRGVPLTIVTLEEPSTGLTRWRDEARRRAGIKTVAVGPGREFAFVEMIKVLERGECVAMLVDRPYMGSGSPVTFFGQPVQFSSAPALLRQHTGAAVVPAFVVRHRYGRYLSFAEPPVEMTSEPDKRTALIINTQRIATVFESVIRRYPDQWFNYVPAFPPPAA